MRPLAFMSLCYALGALACSTAPMQDRRTNTSRDRINLQHIQTSTAGNAFDLIRRARPNWLLGRGIKSLKYQGTSYPAVYVDGQRYGDIESLTTIATEHIVGIQFYNSGEATARFGLDHPGGAILVTLR